MGYIKYCAMYKGNNIEQLSFVMRTIIVCLQRRQQLSGVYINLMGIAIAHDDIF